VRGEYLILLTLAFQMVSYGLMLSWVDLTAGRTGISGIPRPRLFGKTLVTPAEFLPLIAAGALVTFAIAYRIGESPLGRVLKAMRDDETATLAIGKSVLRYKVLVFCVSGGLAGVAAGLFAHYQAFINLEVVTAVADHAYFMEAGRIIAEGRPEELMADRRLADIYFGKARR
jgi:ABC-type branched-subunit amino acid transport system permease subunit